MTLTPSDLTPLQTSQALPNTPPSASSEQLIEIIQPSLPHAKTKRRRCYNRTFSFGRVWKFADMTPHARDWMRGTMKLQNSSKWPHGDRSWRDFSGVTSPLYCEPIARGGASSFELFLIDLCLSDLSILILLLSSLSICLLLSLPFWLLSFCQWIMTWQYMSKYLALWIHVRVSQFVKFIHHCITFRT